MRQTTIPIKSEEFIELLKTHIPNHYTQHHVKIKDIPKDLNTLYWVTPEGKRIKFRHFKGDCHTATFKMLLRRVLLVGDSLPFILLGFDADLVDRAYYWNELV